MKASRNWTQIGNSVLASAAGIAAIGAAFLGTAGLIGGLVAGAVLGAVSSVGIKPHANTPYERHKERKHKREYTRFAEKLERHHG